MRLLCFLLLVSAGAALHAPQLLPPPRRHLLTKNETARPCRPADTASKQLVVPYEHEWWWWA